MDATGKRRLLKLADFLETKVPARRFHLRNWADDDFAPDHCGTVACACGWGTAIPSLFRAGLRLDRHGDLQGDWDTVESVFRLEGDDAEYLFAYWCYSNNPTPKQVAKRIRSFVKERSK